MSCADCPKCGSPSVTRLWGSVWHCQGCGARLIREPQKLDITEELRRMRRDLDGAKSETARKARALLDTALACRKG